MKVTIRFIFAAFFIVLLTGMLYAQSTDIKLSTLADTISSFRVLNSDGSTRMRINSNGSFFLYGANMDTKLLWNPGKYAFRAGYAVGNLWNNIKVGNYSLATGYNTVASGDYSTALGYESVADGIGSVAIGFNDTANGDYSTALGRDVNAIGDYSFATGYQTSASGSVSAAFGYLSTASGPYSFAHGNYTTSSGYYSVAMGAYTTAAGDYSIALGRRAVNSNAGHNGVFIFADANSFDFPSTAANQFRVRATGGAQIVTGIDGSGNPNAGVRVASGGGSWSAISDRNLKANFKDVNGRSILALVASMPVQIWNYRAQNNSIRHIGPMAQDFYAAFKVGEDDKHITTIDADGVALAAIQGLNEIVKEKDVKIIELEKRIEKLEQIISSSTINNNSSIIENK